MLMLLVSYSDTVKKNQQFENNNIAKFPVTLVLPPP